MPATVFKRAVTRVGVAAADGRPLYAYRLTGVELHDLETALRGRFRGGTTDLQFDDAMALCLFASSWFCEHHDGGAWSWDPMWTAIGFQGSYMQWQELIRAGFQHLRRPLVRVGDRRMFLVTVACEGGLPLRMLREDRDSTLGRYIRHVLEGRERFGVAARELAERWEDELPKGLQNEVVYELVGALIEAVVELRRTLPDTGDPMKELDRLRHGWRDGLPLRLDDDVARQLLLGLLRAPKPVAERTAVPASLTVELSLAPAPALARRVHLLPHATRKAVEEWLGVAVRGRFRLWLTRGGAHREPLAMARPINDRVHLDAIGGGSLPIERAEDRVEVVAALGATELTRIAIPGGEPLGELPWVFAPRADGTWVLVGQGGARSRHAQLIAALPPGASWCPADHVVELGTLAVGAESRVLLRTTGPLTVTHDEETSVVTPSAVDEGRSVELRGRRLQLGPTGDEVRLGVPTVIDAATRAPVPHVLTWRPRTGGAWRSEPPRGAVVLRVLVDGEVQLRESATILPETFTARLMSGALPTEGKLVLGGLGRADVVRASAEHGEASVERAGDLVEVRCRARPGQPLGDVTLDLLLGGRYEARVRSSPPVTCFRFLGPGGVPVPAKAQRSLGGFVGIRAHVIDARPGAQYEVVARPPIGREVALGRLLPSEAGAFELSLDAAADEVAALLAIGNDLDATVTLAVHEVGVPRAKAELRVSTYEAWLDRRGSAAGDPEVMDLDLVGHRADVPLDRVRLEARPLAQPGAEPEMLQSDRPGGWLLSLKGREPGPWLVTGWLGEHAFVRPLLVTVRGEAKPTNGIEAAVAEGDVKRRHQALASVVQGLAKQADHPDWSRAIEFLRTAATLPPGTFDLTRAIVQEPDAMALAAFLLGPTTLARVAPALERLPFLWCLVRLRSWARAARQLMQAYPTVAPDLLRAGLGWTTERLPARSCVALVVQRATGRIDLAPKGLSGELGGLSSLVKPAEPAQKSASGRIRREADPAKRTASGRIRREPSLLDLMEGRLGDARNQLLCARTDADWWPADTDDQLVGTLGLRSRWSALERLRIEAPHPHQRAVLDAPLLAAAACAFGIEPRDDAVARLRRLRAFDEQFFDDAYQAQLIRLLPQAIQNDPELSA